MNKRIKKKYESLRKAAYLEHRINTLENLESKNIETINKKFAEYDKKMASLENELKHCKHKKHWLDKK